MPSNERSDRLDLEKGLPTSAADVLALRRLRQPRPVSTAEFLRFLALLGPPRPEDLRARRGPRGPEPFRL
ncbi:MAG TPA: hypothetical protein VI589_08025 [Vicinamibacteria bacterium]